MRVKVLGLTVILMSLLLLDLLISAVLETAGVIDGRTFRRIHPLAGYSFVTVAVLHLYLNWNWVRARFRARPKRGAKVTEE